METSDAWPFAKPPGWNERSDKEFGKWMQRHGPETTQHVLDRVIEYCRESYGDSVTFGAVGYCFGGRYVMLLMARGLINVGVVAHPSFYTMDEVSALRIGQKLALICAERDDILPPLKRREIEAILSAKGVTWMSAVYGGTNHGFSVRGDLGTKEVKLAKEMAFGASVEWFKAWLFD